MARLEQLAKFKPGIDTIDYVKGTRSQEHTCITRIKHGLSRMLAVLLPSEEGCLVCMSLG